MEKQWKKDPSTVLLIQKAELTRLDLKRIERLGEQGEWILIHRKPKC